VRSALAIVLLVLPFVVGAIGGNYWVRVLDFAMLYVMLALGLNVVVGFAGLLDLGYIAFYAVGAYVAALLSSPHLLTQFAGLQALFPTGLHLPFLFVSLIAIAAAALFGVLLGAPTLRLRGDYLALMTLGFGEIIRIFMNNLDRPVNITNGPKGISGIAPVQIFSFDFSKAHDVQGVHFSAVQQYFYLFAAVVSVMVLICTRLQHSRTGRAWAAIREDEVAARAMGINARNLKLLAFAMGASFGGIAGALFAALQGFVSPESFTFWESIVVLACVVLGGNGHIPGVIAGAVLLSVFPEFLRSAMGPLQRALSGHEVVSVEVLRQLIYGLGMIVIMLYRPAGLWPATGHARAKRYQVAR